MEFYDTCKVGDLVNVVAYYRDEVKGHGILMQICKYGMFYKILLPDGYVKEFDTVYYYLEKLE
jgi:hypothetical protein